MLSIIISLVLPNTDSYIFCIWVDPDRSTENYLDAYSQICRIQSIPRTHLHLSALNSLEGSHTARPRPGGIYWIKRNLTGSVAYIALQASLVLVVQYNCLSICLSSLQFCFLSVSFSAISSQASCKGSITHTFLKSILLGSAIHPLCCDSGSDPLEEDNNRTGSRDPGPG